MAPSASFHIPVLFDGHNNNTKINKYYDSKACSLRAHKEGMTKQKREMNVSFMKEKESLRTQ